LHDRAMAIAQTLEFTASSFANGKRPKQSQPMAAEHPAVIFTRSPEVCKHPCSPAAVWGSPCDLVVDSANRSKRNIARRSKRPTSLGRVALRYYQPPFNPNTVQARFYTGGPLGAVPLRISGERFTAPAAANGLPGHRISIATSQATSSLGRRSPIQVRSRAA